MTQPAVVQPGNQPGPDESVAAEPLNESEISEASDAEAAEEENEEENTDSEEAQDESGNQPAARKVTVKLPDEPYDFQRCVVTVTLGFLPGNDDPDERPVIAMIDSHGEAPTKTIPLRLRQLQPLPPWLQELFEAHIAALPGREAEAKARQAEEAKREAERQARRSPTRNTASTKSAKKGKLANLEDAQEVLFGGEPLSVAAPAQPETSPSTPTPAVPTPPAPPALSTPPAAPPLTLGSTIPAPTKRPAKKQAVLEDPDALQDVLFG